MADEGDRNAAIFSQMRQRVKNELSRNHKILCLDTGHGGFNQGPQWNKLPQHAKEAYYLAQNGSVTPKRGYGDDFRYAMGYEPDDERFQILDVQRQPSATVRMSDYDALIITGSGKMVTEVYREEWFGKLICGIRAAIDAGLPTLGICFGHQAVAHEQRPREDRRNVGPMRIDSTQEVREFGIKKINITPRAGEDSFFSTIGDSELWIPTSHSQEVTQKPKGAILMAHNPASRIQALAYRQENANVSTFQGHPELTRIALFLLAAELRRDAIQQEMAALSSDRCRTYFGAPTYDEMVSILFDADYATEVAKTRQRVFSGFLNQIANHQARK